MDYKAKIMWYAPVILGAALVMTVDHLSGHVTSWWTLLYWVILWAAIEFGVHFGKLLSIKITTHHAARKAKRVVK